MSELKMSRDDMVQELTTRECRVQFTKGNGDMRDMRCTLNSDSIPQQQEVTGMTKAPRPVNESVIAVWDLVAKGWRSFRVDSVVSFA